MTIYGSAADFRTYHNSRNREISSDWDDSLIQAALLVGSEWIDNKFGNLFSGFPTDGFLQVRQWPRASAYTNTYPSYAFAMDEIPDRVKYAAYEAAFRELTEPGCLNVDYTPSEFKMVKVEGAIQLEYAGVSQSTEIQKQIGIVEQILSPLLDFYKSGNVSSLSGSLVRG